MTLNVYLPYWNRLRQDAARKGYVFDITLEDILKQFTKQKGVCPYTGNLLELPFRSTIDGDRKWRGNASIDRIDNTRGYELDNIQWVYKPINKLKHTLCESEFLNLCKSVASHD